MPNQPKKEHYLLLEDFVKRISEASGMNFIGATWRGGEQEIIGYIEKRDGTAEVWESQEFKPRSPSRLFWMDTEEEFDRLDLEPFSVGRCPGNC